MSLTAEQVLTILKETGVYREGHFLLTSGLHSDRFMLMAHALQYPDQCETLCRALAEPWQQAGIECVVGPAVGGILLAYETARALKCRAIFAEKTGEGRMALKRQFTLRPGERVLVVEDALSTGGSVRQVLEAIAPLAPTVVGVGALVDRTGGKGDFGFGVPHQAVLSLEIPSWQPSECPLCKAGEPLVKPKS